MHFKSILLLVIIDITCITIVLIKIKTSLVSPNGILEMRIALFHWPDQQIAPPRSHAIGGTP